MAPGMLKIVVLLTYLDPYPSRMMMAQDKELWFGIASVYNIPPKRQADGMEKMVCNGCLQLCDIGFLT